MAEQQIPYKKASVYYLVGNLFNKGIAFLTVPIFTRILSTTDYGMVTTFNSWAAILTMVMGFAVHMGIRSAFIDYGDHIDDIMSVTTTFTLLCGALFIFFVGLGTIMLKVSIGITVVILCLLQGLASAVIQNYSMYLMMKYRYKFRTVLMIFPNLISACLSVVVILVVIKTDLYMGRIIPTALVTSGFGILLIILVYRKSRVIFNKKYLQYVMGVSAPLVLHGIALNILSQSDRTMITWLTDASQTGIYSLIYNFSMIATVITTSLEGVWVPWFTGKLKINDTKNINIMAGDYINLMTCAMFCLILTGPEIVKLLADRRYWEGIGIIPPIVLSNYVIFAYTLYVNIEHFHKRTVYITVNTLIAAITNIILNFLFIPEFGYVAAAYTTLASYALAFVLHARYAKKLEPVLYPLKSFQKPLLHICASVVLFYGLIAHVSARWGIVISYIVVMFIREKKYFDEWNQI